MTAARIGWGREPLYSHNHHGGARIQRVSPALQSRVRVNGATVRSTRLRVGLSERETIERLNSILLRYDDEPVSTEQLRQWETGDGQPTVPEAEALADVLLLPFCTLLSSTKPPPDLVDFRRGPLGKAGPLSYETFRKLEQFHSFYRLAKELALATGRLEDVHVPPPPRGLLGDRDAVEQVGGRIRAAWGLTAARQLNWNTDEEAFEDVKAAVEATGVFVFSLSLNVEEVRGASRWAPGGPPAILVNLADSVTARLFTLAHEYAHLVLAKPGRAFVCDPSSPSLAAEALANKVAASALVPQELLSQILEGETLGSAFREWPAPVRTALRRAFRVSNDVIGIRLSQLGIVTDPGLTKGFWRRGKGFGRGNKPLAQRYRRYLGERSISLAAEAVSSESVSVAEISRVLGIGVTHVEGALGVTGDD